MTTASDCIRLNLRFDLVSVPPVLLPALRLLTKNVLDGKVLRRSHDLQALQAGERDGEVSKVALAEKYATPLSR